jgi:hypothetical protein
MFQAGLRSLTPVATMLARGARNPRLFSLGDTFVKEVILTKEGYEKLKREIEYLSTDKRREVAD